MELIDALRICIDMWTWLANHPTSHKSDYLNNIHPELPFMHNDCPLCQYTLARKLHCTACPIAWGTSDNICTLSTGSPYTDWLNSQDPATRRTAALEIVRRAKDALAALTDNDIGEP